MAHRNRSGAETIGMEDLRACAASANKECNEVLIEAGPTLSGAFIKQKRVDELIIYMAPTLLGSQAKPLFDMVMERMSERLQLSITDMRTIGSDLRLIVKFN